MRVGCLKVLTTAMLTVVVPELLASGLLAYTIGLRHAVDADHIAAIDNIAKRLLVSAWSLASSLRLTTLKKGSAMAGFFFALGHSTVVLIMRQALKSVLMCGLRCSFIVVGREHALKHLLQPRLDSGLDGQLEQLFYA